MGTPKKGTPNFRKPHIGFHQGHPQGRCKGKGTFALAAAGKYRLAKVCTSASLPELDPNAGIPCALSAMQVNNCEILGPEHFLFNFIWFCRSKIRIDQAGVVW